MIKSVTWIIGEFAELFANNNDKFSVNVSKLISIFEKFEISEFEDITAFYVFICLAKMYVKLDD